MASLGHNVNSLSHEMWKLRCGCNFTSIGLYVELILRIDILRIPCGICLRRMPQHPIDNKSALFRVRVRGVGQVAAWCRQATCRPLPEPMLTQIYVAIWRQYRPQWVIEYTNGTIFQSNMTCLEINNHKQACWDGHCTSEQRWMIFSENYELTYKWHYGLLGKLLVPSTMPLGTGYQINFLRSLINFFSFQLSKQYQLRWDRSNM